MDYKLKKINKKTTFCTMCFDLGMEKFAKMRNDNSRNNYEEYYLKPLLTLCKNFPNLVVYCDKKTEIFIKKNLSYNTSIKIISFDSFRQLKYFDKETKFKELTKNVYHNYPEHKNDFSLFSLNRLESDYQAIYSLLVLNKIYILNEVSKINPYNTEYFAWIDTGCFQEKYSKFWQKWKNKIYINTKKFKCCVNINNSIITEKILRLNAPSVVLKPTETIEAIAPFFYIHKSNIENFYKQYNKTIEELINLNLPCTEQAVWTWMLLNNKKRNLFFPVACNDYNGVIALVSTCKEKLKLSTLGGIRLYLVNFSRGIMKNIFNIQYSNNHKIFTILGIKFKFKTKSKNNICNIDQKKIEQDFCKKIQKILYKPNKIEQIEINLTSHCNLNCQMCDHFSPIAKKEFADVNIVKKDLKRLSELTNKQLDRLLLLGGEPLLHPKINLFIESARECFPTTDIIIFTNAILLNKMTQDFWQTCQKFNATITYTKYPINIDFKELENRAKSYGVKLINAEYQEGKVKTSWKFPLDLTGSQNETYNFLNCIHATKCINLENGKMYTCTVAPNIRHFNKFFKKNVPLVEEDGIDIYKVANLNELIDFLHKPIPFCKYCNIDARKTDIPFAISKKDIKEWT